MAEIVATAFVTVLCEKLISGDLMRLARSHGMHSQLKKWKETLPLIQAVLDDASRKQITNNGVRLWLNDLQYLAYDIEDVLDDLATEAMRRKLNQESHATTNTSTSMVLKIIPTCCTNFSRNIRYDRHMSFKLDEITTKLNELVELKNALGLVVDVNVERLDFITEGGLEQTSLVDLSKITGREGDTEAVLNKLLGGEACDANVRIVSIVGPGGVGKTTLAKVLYNQEKVEDHFVVRAWVSVSGKFNVFTISKAIFQAVGGEDKSFANLNLLHVALKEKLINKRFLLVLDDVWDFDWSKWELLLSPLAGSCGSKILVTSRDVRVDSDETHHLDVLSGKDAMRLFAQHALGENDFSKHPTLQLHGDGYVRKCCGLPLALKTLGKVLRGCTDDVWERLLNSEIWDIDDGGKILPALRISYNHLPPHLKLLFAYCSLFSKDYVFDKKELVLMWMAQGFLSQSNNKSMERLGYQYFEELKSRSFFQQSTNDELGCTMHDLIIDLARSVAGEFSFRWDEYMYSTDRDVTPDKFCHISLLSPGYAFDIKLNELQEATRLRTFLPILVGPVGNQSSENDIFELLPKLQYLRVLSLTHWLITEVPRSIGSLKHLRYLNFSYSAITFLPEQVTDLYNLQTLLVRDCSELSSLPSSFGKLKNLRHFDISGTLKLIKMPWGIGGLTSLQTLPKVIIGGPNEFEISELKGLSDLQGRLSIMGLDKVINSMEAKVANLHQKKDLDVLEMEWSDVFDDSRDEKTEYEVFEGLRPHHRLRNLKISFYTGTRFPSWLGDPSFDHLTEITICGCTSTHLPTLGRLRLLKKLLIQGMKEVKTVDFELLAPTNSFLDIAFPSLEVLEFDDMQGWQRWSTSGGGNNRTTKSFPCLREISIKRCSELVEVSIGLIPSLLVLRIEACSETVLRSLVGASPSLVTLKMSNVRGFAQFHEDDLMHLKSVEDLYIDNSDELSYLWERASVACKLLVRLQKLVVCDCKMLVSIAEKEVDSEITMRSVKQVIIRNCDTLKSYNCPKSVERLVISYCY